MDPLSVLILVVFGFFGVWLIVDAIRKERRENRLHEQEMANLEVAKAQADARAEESRARTAELELRANELEELRRQDLIKFGRLLEAAERGEEPSRETALLYHSAKRTDEPDSPPGRRIQLRSGRTFILLTFKNYFPVL